MAKVFMLLIIFRFSIAHAHMFIFKEIKYETSGPIGWIDWQSKINTTMNYNYVCFVFLKKKKERKKKHPTYMSKAHSKISGHLNYSFPFSKTPVHIHSS